MRAHILATPATPSLHKLHITPCLLNPFLIGLPCYGDFDGSQKEKTYLHSFLFGKSDTQWTTSAGLAIPCNLKLKSPGRFTSKVLTAVVLYAFADGRQDCISCIILG